MICTQATPNPGIWYFCVNIETPWNHLCYMRAFFWFLIPDDTIETWNTYTYSLGVLTSAQMQSSVMLILISELKAVSSVTPEEQQKYPLAEETHLCRRQMLLESQLKGFVCLYKVCWSSFISRPSSGRSAVCQQKCPFVSIISASSPSENLCQQKDSFWR